MRALCLMCRKWAKKTWWPFCTQRCAADWAIAMREGEPWCKTHNQYADSPECATGSAKCEHEELPK